jgi:glycosyltransferase involved in cell wall biosynthesis
MHLKTTLFIVSTTRKTGPTQQLLNLCRLLPEFGYQPRLLTLSPDPPDNMAARFAAAGVESRSLKLSRLEGLLHLKSRVRGIVADLKPDIIHSQGIRSDQIASAVHGRIPHVLTVRNYAWDDYPPMFGMLRGSLMAWQHLRLIRHAQCPVACSHSLVRQLSRTRPGITAVCNGVDTDLYSPATQEARHSLRSALRLPADRPILVHVGSLIPRKRPEVLLRSFLQSNLDAVLVFLGEGPLRKDLELAAQGRANVRFTGAVNNVADYLRCSDLLVSVSSSEGLPNSVLEALACGLPVVLSDIDSHAEIGVRESGAGVMVNADKEIELVEAIRSTLQLDRHRLARNARDLAEGSFSSRATAKKYADIYGALMQRRGHG